MLRVRSPSLSALALVLAGCGSVDASATPPTPTTTPSPTACDSSATLNLRTPAGETLNLTGYWVSGETQNTFWRIAQYGTCMAWRTRGGSVRRFGPFGHGNGTIWVRYTGD